MNETRRRHFCIFRTDGIGDVLLTLPVADALRTQEPLSRITFCVREPLAELVRLSPLVDDVLTVESRDTDAPHLFAKRLSAAAIDAAVHAYPRPGFVRATRAARIPIRVGTSFRWYSPLLTHRVREHRRDARFHESAYNLHLLDPLGIAYSTDTDPSLSIPEPLAAEARALLAEAGISAETPFVILHPGSAGSAKDWSAENFGLLAERVDGRFPGIAVLVTGTSAERHLIQIVRARCPAARSFGDELTLVRLAAVISLSSLIVANSTGPLHIGAAVGVPVVGLYPNKRVCHPRRWGPRTPKGKVFLPPPEKGCISCEKGDCETHDRMERISIDEVFDAVREILEGTALHESAYTSQTG